MEENERLRCELGEADPLNETLRQELANARSQAYKLKSQIERQHRRICEESARADAHVAELERLRSSAVVPPAQSLAIGVAPPDTVRKRWSREVSVQGDWDGDV